MVEQASDVTPSERSTSQNNPRRFGWMWNLDLPELNKRRPYADEVVDLMTRLKDELGYRFTPTRAELYAAGPESFLIGLAPNSPFIHRDTRVIAIGSCFAAHFAEWLAENGFNQKFSSESDESVVRHIYENPLSIAQQFRWAFDEFDPDLAFWFDSDKSRVEATDGRRHALRRVLEEADVLVITLGLSELWQETASGEPLWRTPPRAFAESGHFAPKIASVAETKHALETIERLREAYMPRARIIFTVSPVHLQATFRSASPMVANTASKAIIRAALDEFLRDHPDKFNSTYFYFPSFEIVKEFLVDPFQDDNVHVRDDYVRQILQLFARFYVSDMRDAPSFEAYSSSIVAEMQSRIRDLTVQLSEYRSVSAERLAVIDELKSACDSRLELINKLEATCKERLEQNRTMEASIRWIESTGVLRDLL